MEPKLFEGIWVGIDARSNGYKVLGEDGQVVVRTVRRRVFAERWSAEALLNVSVTPWKPRVGAAEVRRVAIRVDRDALVAPEDDGPVARRLGLKSFDFDGFGFTAGCRGCGRLRLGLRANGHSDSCRSRIERCLAGTEAGRGRLDREKLRLDEAYYRLTKHEVEGEPAKGEQPQAENQA